MKVNSGCRLKECGFIVRKNCVIRSSAADLKVEVISGVVENFHQSLLFLKMIDLIIRKPAHIRQELLSTLYCEHICQRPCLGNYW